MRTNWKKIVYCAAEEAYRHEVIETLMQPLIVGEGKEYEDKQDWIDARVQEWIDAESNDNDS